MRARHESVLLLGARAFLPLYSVAPAGSCPGGRRARRRVRSRSRPIMACAGRACVYAVQWEECAGAVLQYGLVTSRPHVLLPHRRVYHRVDGPYSSSADPYVVCGYNDAGLVSSHRAYGPFPFVVRHRGWLDVWLPLMSPHSPHCCQPPGGSGTSFRSWA